MKRLKKIILEIPLLNKFAIFLYYIYNINTIKEKTIFNQLNIEDLNLKIIKLNQEIENTNNKIAMLKQDISIFKQDISILGQKANKIYIELDHAIEIEVQNKFKKILIEIENLNKTRI